MAQQILLDGNRYILTEGSAIVRRTLNDWPRPSPATGRQDPQTRYLRTSLVIGDITNAFAGKTLLLGAQVDLHFEHGHMHVLQDSTVWTHQGRITLARLDTDPNPNLGPGTIVLGLAAHGFGDDGGSRPASASGTNRNPKPWRFFAGTTYSGVFIGATDDRSSGNYDVLAMRWTSTAWTEEYDLGATAREDVGALDLEVHKGALLLLHSDGTSQVWTSTNGDNFAAMTYDPGAAADAYPGSRLLSDGNMLHAFIMANNREQFTIYNTADSGGTAWTTRVTAADGQLRDVGFFADRDGTSRIVVLTERVLQWYDTTNYVLNLLWTPPFSARAMQEFGGWLYVFMDQGRVSRIRPEGGILRVEDVSPGGAEGMPSGKDFGASTASSFHIASTSLGIYALWTGLDAAGEDQKPLILLRKENGWHFIWQDTAARPSGSGRFLAFDPLTGDLLWGIQTATDGATETTGYRMVTPEVPFDLGSPTFQAAGYFTMLLMDFGGPSIATTLWDVFLNTQDLTASQTVRFQYGADGVSETTSDLGTAVLDLSTLTFPTSSSAVGVSLNTFEARVDLARDSGTTTATPKIISLDISYYKVPDVRWAYEMDLDIPATASLSVYGGDTQAVRTTLETTLDSKVKVTLAYGDRTGLSVLPLPENVLTETVEQEPGLTAGKAGVERVHIVLAEL